LLATVLLVLTFGRWRERRIFALLVVALLGTFLFYTVMAVFMSVFLALLLTGLALFGPRQAGGQALVLFGAVATAFALAVAVYYGQYIPSLIERTIPYVSRTVVAGETNPGQTEHEPFWTYIARHSLRLGYMSYPVRYGLWLPLLASLPGAWLLRRPEGTHRLAMLVIGAWYGVALLFLLVGSRVSMVDKHFFYLAPAAIICTAALLDELWRRWRWTGAAIALAYGGTLISALHIWILRLQRTSA
jgi:hypothetical protein